MLPTGMQSPNTFQNSSTRRLSVPATISSRRVSEPSIPTTSFSTSTAGSHSTISTSAASPPHSQSSPTHTYLKTPLVMTPVSQLSKSSRRSSRSDAPFGDRPLNWDPEQYNPDGSLRTVHTLPSFEQSYSQALHTRYIRHRGGVEMEKELSVNEIFAKDDQ